MTQMIPAWVDGTLTAVEKYDVHRRGLRHPAISVFLLDEEGRILLQQRALSKYHTPGLWANTCCTHPHWGEDPKACAHRRLREELGLDAPDLQHCGQIEYRAEVGTDMIEHEVVDLFVGYYPGSAEITPNPSEVHATCWRSPSDLHQSLREQPARFTPWLQIYMEKHAELLFAPIG
ncbi:isopentenyl-diphosphate Delta-isomerase [Phaeobacter sp.]|uniref:isopentenyl-diphosphate Delta-isomerase n=1 Tax=Phaeobacter sp. TaxID=1902409 RepID=UPI0025E25E97|nr:isopentenyl-diphosphate Delta-isomerase [Phaeobacter sp.]